ncbi:MAG: ribonuclease H-like domain-containing protein, partial [bacterium]
TYRLSVIERQALDIERGTDIDSSQIPGIYLEYLRTGDGGLLDPVFAHNRQDVACLLHLRRRVRRWIEEREDPPAPVDWEGLGMLRLHAADESGAEDALRRALCVEDDPAVRWRIATRLARLLRRAARYEDLLALWEREVGGRGVWRVRALIEVAKVYQWRLRRPDRAISALEEAAGFIEWLVVRDDPMGQALDDAVRARLTRLRNLRRPTRRAGRAPESC